jgi:hypothetical protein
LFEEMPEVMSQRANSFFGLIQKIRESRVMAAVPTALWKFAVIV